VSGFAVTLIEQYQCYSPLLACQSLVELVEQSRDEVEQVALRVVPGGDVQGTAAEAVDVLSEHSAGW
jgi:hypothetical protein